MLANIVPKLEDCGPQELSNLWWALGTLRWRLGPAVQEELAAELRVNVLELNAGETAMVLWALARCAPAARSKPASVSSVCTRLRMQQQACKHCSVTCCLLCCYKL